MHVWNVTKLWEFKKDFWNVNHGWDFIMDSQKNTHLDFRCVADKLSLEHTPLSVLLMNCLQSKIPFSVLRMNCLQSKIPFSALLMNCYRRFPAKQSTILTAEYNPCSPQLIDPPSINHSTGVTGMRQSVRRVTFRAQSAIEVWHSRLNKLQKYDPVGPLTYRNMTLWAQ